MSGAAESNSAPPARPVRGLAEAIGEHADCAGVLDVQLDSESRCLNLKCPACGAAVRHPLPAAAGIHGAEPVDGPGNRLEPADAADPGVAPHPLDPDTGVSVKPGAAGPGTSTGGRRSGVLQADLSERLSTRGPESERAVAVPSVGPFSEGPGVAGPALTSKPIEEESEGRRSLLRMLAPVLAVFAVFGALVAALLAFDSSDADEASVASAPAETSVEQPEGAAGGAEGRGQGGGSDDGSQAENGNGGERGGGGERSASVQGGKKQSEPSSNDGQAMRLGFVEVADALRVGLPGDWSQRTVTSDGAVVFAPPEASVTVRAWADSGSGLNRREMASASAELLAARQPNANVGDPEFGGGDVRIRSKYDGGVEVARVFIDDGSRILAVSTVPEGASRVRADEAAAVLASVGAP